jgi:hypothetical protein
MPQPRLCGLQALITAPALARMATLPEPLKLARVACRNE